MTLKAVYGTSRITMAKSLDIKDNIIKNKKTQKKSGYRMDAALKVVSPRIELGSNL